MVTCILAMFSLWKMQIHPLARRPATLGGLSFLDAGIGTSSSPDTINENGLDLFHRGVLLNDGVRWDISLVERAKYERYSQIEGWPLVVVWMTLCLGDRRKRGLTLGAVQIGSLRGKI